MTMLVSGYNAFNAGDYFSGWARDAHDGTHGQYPQADASRGRSATIGIQNKFTTLFYRRVNYIRRLFSKCDSGTLRGFIWRQAFFISRTKEKTWLNGW